MTRTLPQRVDREAAGVTGVHALDCVELIGDDGRAVGAQVASAAVDQAEGRVYGPARVALQRDGHGCVDQVYGGKQEGCASVGREFHRRSIMPHFRDCRLSTYPVPYPKLSPQYRAYLRITVANLSGALQAAILLSEQ